MFAIMNDYPHDYYVIITEVWRPANKSIQEQLKAAGYKRGDVTKLPIQKKQEVLSVVGRTKDGKEELSTMYDIIRVRPEDDSSQILRFEKIATTKEGAHIETRPEIAPIILEMHRSAEVNQKSRPRLLFPDREYPIPTLEDLETCLPMFNFTEQRKYQIARSILHNMPNIIRNAVKRDQRNPIKIIDADGKTELSIDALIEKYYPNRAEAC
jgi:hypothetical protein